MIRLHGACSLQKVYGDKYSDHKSKYLIVKRKNYEEEGHGLWDHLMGETDKV